MLQSTQPSYTLDIGKKITKRWYYSAAIWQL